MKKTMNYIIAHSKIAQKLINAERQSFVNKMKLSLTNTSPSIICSNCNGGIVSHDLGLRFLSPTINLWFTPGDFLKLVSNPQMYFSIEPVPLKTNLSYPVGRILDINVYFQHYNSFDEAKEKWIERCSRIDYDNIYLMMTDRDGCTIHQIKQFDELPYNNKVIFTHKPYPMFKSAFYIKGFEDKEECGVLTEFRDGLLRRRYIDDFDIVKFLNQSKA